MNAIYDTELSYNLSIDSLIRIFKDNSVEQIFFKILSPNDNSKNQPYMAGHITDISFLPTGTITETPSNSNKTKDPRRKIKYIVELNFSWLSPDGKINSAPYAKLIYYPQYPEVRLSGFVSKCGFDMGGWMDPTKKGRAFGRVLFLGVKKTGEIIAYLAVPESRIANEINDYPFIEMTGVFNELNLEGKSKIDSSKAVLLQELRRIHETGWIESKKLNRDGIVGKYKAQNGGGYTLEAELGITPNGYADPDFMGWEIKQFGVNRCELLNGKALTILTPEPDGGFYVDEGVESFIHKYGYKSTTTLDRLDFTGRHIANKVCSKSGLMLIVQGYDNARRIITDAGGCIALLDSSGNPASIWSFCKLMEHWKRKHAKAAYIPSLSKIEAEKIKSYLYCNNVRLFEGTTFMKLLQAVTESYVYYDPGIKVENESTKPVSKRRSQFRIKSGLLNHLYGNQSDIDVLIPLNK